MHAHSAQRGSNMSEQGDASLCLPAALGQAWLALSTAQQGAFLAANAAAQVLALGIACTVAEATADTTPLRTAPLIGRRGEKDVLEAAVRELQQVVIHPAASGQSMDGQIPLWVQGKRGRIGIEVKAYQATVGADEVQKFVRDVGSNDFAVALLVSTRSPIARKRKGLQLEKVVTTRGLTWCLFVSPVHDMTGLVTSALSMALELAVDTRPGTASLADDVGERMQQEVHALAGIKRKLREEDGRAQASRDLIADALTASQHRLAAAVDTMVRRAEDTTEGRVGEQLPAEETPPGTRPIPAKAALGTPAPQTPV